MFAISDFAHFQHILSHHQHQHIKHTSNTHHTTMNTKTFVLLAIAAVASQVHACTNVSVEGDATYCIDGPVCSGSGDAPAGVNCPVAGTKASMDCHNNVASFLGDGNCVAPQDAKCEKIHTGAWGCVFPQEDDSYDHDTYEQDSYQETEAPATQYKKAKHAKKAHKAEKTQKTAAHKTKSNNNKHHDCTDVSVEGGSTVCIPGPVCSGSGDSPAGWNCPSGSMCKKLHTGAWGCSINFHKKDHHKSHQKGCTPVSVEGDHTYCIDGPICSGSGDSPAGWNCPAGSVCKKIKTGAWGCSIWY